MDRSVAARRLDTPYLERVEMRYPRLLTLVFLIALASGPASALRAGTPADSLWLKAVSISEKNDDLVPGLMKMHMQEVDKHGKPKDLDKYHEVWSTLSLGEDGEVEYEMIKTVENGKDVTEEEKAKEEKEKAREKDGDDEEGGDGESHEMKGYSPFDSENQGAVSIAALGSGGIVNGKSTAVYEFSERTPDDIEISGKAWLQIDTGVPVRVEYTPDPLPKRVKRMVTTMEYNHIYPDSLVVSRMFVEVTGGILFIKKHFHMDMTFDEYWRLPEGYDAE